MTQIIYFDQEDADTDGLGWNIVDDGAVALRFATLRDARLWCAAQNCDYIVERNPPPV